MTRLTAGPGRMAAMALPALAMMLASGRAMAQEAAESAAAAATAAAEAAGSAASAAGDAATAAVAAAAAATPAPAAEIVPINSGDTAWMLTSTALVLMMTIPGLALFYGGLVRKANVLSLLMQCFSITALVTVLWMVVGYSIAFTTNENATLNMFMGDFSKMLLNGMTPESKFSDSATIPESVFMTFQMTFAIITPALIVGAFADRMKFSALMIFTALWLVLVYAPLCHMVWNGGLLAADGVLDFAGGTVVHINAGVAGLVAAIMIGKRQGYGKGHNPVFAPHNLILSVIGAGMLWVGWFGFNAGSALSAGAGAGMAMAVTQIATAAATLAWMAVEWAIKRKPSVLGAISGAVAGLVAITPAAGFVDPKGALVIGIAAGIICYFGATSLKRALGYDDALDVFGVHGIGGIVGALLTGVLAVKTDAITPGMGQLLKQLEGVGVAIVFSGVMTALILLVVKALVGLRVSPETERDGLDQALHGESVH